MDQFSALVHVYQATVTMSVQILILHGSSDSTSALGSVFLAYTREQWIFGPACHSYLTCVRVFIDSSLASVSFTMTESQDMKITSIMMNWIMVNATRCTLDSRIKINCCLGDNVFPHTGRNWSSVIIYVVPTLFFFLDLFSFYLSHWHIFRNISFCGPHKKVGLSLQCVNWSTVAANVGDNITSSSKVVIGYWKLLRFLSGIWDDVADLNVQVEAKYFQRYPW